MKRPGPELDAARARVVERGLTTEAVGQLIGVASDLSLEALGRVKQLLKRFFSTEPWTEKDDEALANAVGAGAGSGHHELEPGMTLVWGWEAGGFRLRVESNVSVGAPADGDATAEPELGQTFDGVVVPEATPSPRTIRFATPRLHAGPARTYDPAAPTADPRVARIFREFDEVTNVLVGPDFVAVTISRPDRWERLLGPVLRMVTAEFSVDDGGTQPGIEPQPSVSLRPEVEDGPVRGARRLEHAWAELGALRADRPADLERVLAATRGDEPARRQVGAALLADAPSEAAAQAWKRLLEDPSRSVRRSVVDAVAGAGRQELRPLLERALDDPDAWARWKALRGIATLGVGPSRAAVAVRSTDADFRVRLEAARVLTGDVGE